MPAKPIEHPHFLLESKPNKHHAEHWSVVDPHYGVIVEADRNEANYNAIHQTVLTWDPSALNRKHEAFDKDRRRLIFECLRNKTGCLLLQPQPDQQDPDYGKPNFTQKFWAYLMYRHSSHRGFTDIVSIGVNPDCYRQGYATRLIMRFNALHSKSLLCSAVPTFCLEFCNLLKKANCRCTHHNDQTFLFSWRDSRPF